MPRMILILAILSVLLIAVILYQRNSLTDVEGQLKQKTSALETLDGEYGQAQEAIAQIQKLNIEKQKQLVDLQQTIGKLRTAANERREIVQEIHNEPHNKSWSGIGLPDDIKQLRQRPSITGTGDYHEYLHNTRTLFPDTLRPTNQR